MRHECRTKIQECKLIPDINCVIRKDEDMGIWKLSLVDNDKHVGMGIFIFHCPFCGKRLK